MTNFRPTTLSPEALKIWDEAEANIQASMQRIRELCPTYKPEDCPMTDTNFRARAALAAESAIGIDDCPYCTNGLITVLRNSASYHFDGDEPIAEDEPCEECGGSGKAPRAALAEPVGDDLTDRRSRFGPERRLRQRRNRFADTAAPYRRRNIERRVTNSRAALAEPVGEGPNCARIELVTAIHCLASHLETACSDLSGEDLRKATNDIAHAKSIAAKHNQNGPGCPQFPPAAPPAPVPGEGPSDEEILKIAADALGYESIKPGRYGYAGSSVEASGSELLQFAHILLTRSTAPPAPVVVSERLPGPGEWVWHCYAGVRFWEHGIYNGRQFFIGNGPESQPATHWLPATALPVPEVKP